VGDPYPKSSRRCPTSTLARSTSMPSVRFLLMNVGLNALCVMINVTALHPSTHDFPSPNDTTPYNAQPSNATTPSSSSKSGGTEQFKWDSTFIQLARNAMPVPAPVSIPRAVVIFNLFRMNAATLPFSPNAWTPFLHHHPRPALHHITSVCSMGET